MTRCLIRSVLSTGQLFIPCPELGNEEVSTMNPPAPQPLWYGSLRLPSRYLLSPLAGFTNLPFRRIIHEIGGCGLGTTDLVNARSLLERRPKAFDLIATHPG